MNAPIGTARLVLRRFVPADVPKVFRMSREDTLRAWIPDQVYRDEAEAASVLDHLIAQYDAPGDPRLGAYVLGVQLRHSGELVGHVGLSPFGGEVEVGYAVEIAHQRQGIATEAVRAMCEWATRGFSLPAIVGVAAAANVGSHGVLARAGFRRRGERTMRLQGREQAAVLFSFEPAAATSA